jgi:hypothetical protein
MIDSTVLPTSSGQVNPFRRVCRVETITGNEFRGVSSTGLTAAYTTEGQEVSDHAATLAQPVLSAQRAQVFVPISRELSQDWSSVIDDLGLPLQNAKDDLEADSPAVTMVRQSRHLQQGSQLRYQRRSRCLVARPEDWHPEQCSGQHRIHLDRVRRERGQHHDGHRGCR